MYAALYGHSSGQTGRTGYRVLASSRPDLPAGERELIERTIAQLGITPGLVSANLCGWFWLPLGGERRILGRIAPAGSGSGHTICVRSVCFDEDDLQRLEWSPLGLVEHLQDDARWVPDERGSVPPPLPTENRSDGAGDSSHLPPLPVILPWPLLAGTALAALESMLTTVPVEQRQSLTFAAPASRELADVSLQFLPATALKAPGRETRPSPARHAGRGAGGLAAAAGALLLAGLIVGWLLASSDTRAWERERKALRAQRSQAEQRYNEVDAKNRDLRKRVNEQDHNSTVALEKLQRLTAKAYPHPLELPLLSEDPSWGHLQDCFSDNPDMPRAEALTRALETWAGLEDTVHGLHDDKKTMAKEMEAHRASVRQDTEKIGRMLEQHRRRDLRVAVDPADVADVEAAIDKLIHRLDEIEQVFDSQPK